MATKKREQSASGFYHVYQRGVSQFDIFEDDVDRGFYLERLLRYCGELGVEVHAWCLMSNHTHLLVRAELEALSAMMRKLGSVFARFFNYRHARTGPLFEGRFCSVCVETDEQYVNVMRYIHRNPVHHEEAALCGGYPWSSYAEHLAASPVTCVVGFALSLFGGVEEFARFHRDRDGDKTRHLDIGTSGPMGDDEARRRADEVLAESGFGVAASKIGALPHEARDRAIALVKRAVGCSLRQLQRLTAIAYSVIRRAVDVADIEDEPEEREVSVLKELVVSWGRQGSDGKERLLDSANGFGRKSYPSPT